MADRPEAPENDTQWRTAGDRIQTLLDSCAAGGTAAHERARQLVREVVGLYGAGLERIIQLGEPGLAERLATDDLVASLLLVHGLHPHDAYHRVSDALDRVRPYLGSHGGDVDLLDVTGDTVRLAFTGSCKSCPSSAVTLELAVEDAVRAAAPEIFSIEVVTAETSGGDPGRIADGACEVERARRQLASGARGGRPGARRGGGLPGGRQHDAGVPGRWPGLCLPRPLSGVRRFARRRGPSRGAAGMSALSNAFRRRACGGWIERAGLTSSRCRCCLATACCRWRYRKPWELRHDSAGDDAERSDEEERRL